MKNMKNVGKRALSLLLALLMCMSLLPVEVMAASVQDAAEKQAKEGFVEVDPGELGAVLEGEEDSFTLKDIMKRLEAESVQIRNAEDDKVLVTVDAESDDDVAVTVTEDGLNVDVDEEGKVLTEAAREAAEAEKNEQPDEQQPVEEPTEAPSEEPTTTPSTEPTVTPSTEPTEAPSTEPTVTPSEEPAVTPSEDAGEQTPDGQPETNEPKTDETENDEPKTVVNGESETHESAAPATLKVTLWARYPAVEIPEGAVEITPDKLLESARKVSSMTMESFFGLVQDSKVMGEETKSTLDSLKDLFGGESKTTGTAPETVTFVVKGKATEFSYADAATYGQKVSVTEKAILLDGVEATVYAQGKAEVKDGAETMANTDKGTITLKVDQSTDLSGISGTKTWSSSNTGVASVSNTQKSTARVTGHVAGETTVTHTISSFMGIATETESWTIIVESAVNTVTFDANGGSNAPAAVTLTEGQTEIVLPSGESMTRNGYAFYGWSKNSGTVTETGNEEIYFPGTKYKVTQSETLYAVWYSTNASTAGVHFFIRVDGKMPTEPSNAGASNYTGHDTSSGMYFRAGALKEARYVSDPSGKNVKDNLNNTPTAQAMMTALNKIDTLKGFTVNSAGRLEKDGVEYTVTWYVIKHSSTGYWHVDGVLKEISKVMLSYSANCPQQEITGGTLPTGEQHEPGAIVTVAGTNLQRRGYTFLGWNTQADGSGDNYNPGSSITLGEEDVTLYAQWGTDAEQTKTLSYTVEYYKDGAKVSGDTQTVSKTVQVLQPDTLAVDMNQINTTDKYVGYTFDHTDPSTIPDTVETGTVIKVYYIADDAYIEFVANGGTPAPAMMEGKTGQTITNKTMPTVTKAGYTLEGWYANADFSGNKVEALPEKFPAGTTTYYAKWTRTTPDAPTVVKSFVLEEGATAPEPVKAGDTLTYKLEITPTGTVPVTGFKVEDAKFNPAAAGTTVKVGETDLAGSWDNATKTFTLKEAKTSGTITVTYTYTVQPEDIESASGKVTNTAKVIVLNGTVESPESDPSTKDVPVKYTITYNGLVGATVSGNPETYTVETPDFTLNNPTKPGYTFTGWTGSNGTTASTSVTIAQGTTGNLSYTANWEEKATYTVKYNTDGGTAVDNKTGVKWTDSNLLATTTKVGYDFVGWFTDATEGTKVTETTTYAELAVVDTKTEVTLYARWAEKATYTVKYDLGYETDATITAKTGVKWTQNDLLPVPAPTRAGYDFVGWFTAKENGEQVKAETTYAKLAGNDTVTSVTLYAHWTEKGNVVINYVALEGGSVDKLSETLKPATGNAEGSVPTAEAGYEFDYWYTRTADGSELQVSGGVDETTNKLTPAKVDGLNVAATYYAKFKAMTDTGYTVEYYLQKAVDSTEYKLDTTDSKQGTTGTIAVADVKEYTGYKLNQKVEGTKLGGTITGDGSLVLKLYYDIDSNQKHSVSAQVKYYYGDTLEAAQAKTDADATDAVQTAESWIGEAATVTVAPNTSDKFVGYTYSTTEGDLSYKVEAGAASDPTTHVVKVYYVKDEGAKHSIKAQVEYYYGDNIEAAKAKDKADATDEVKTGESWIGEAATVTVTPNVTNKFVGYKYAETVGNTSYTLAANAATDETVHVVKVYYVKDDSQTQPTKYTVQHVVEGETTPRFTQDYTSTAWVKDEPAKITIVDGSLDQKTITGYMFKSINPVVEEGDEVDTDTVITLTYEKDEEGQKHSISAKVEYYTVDSATDLSKAALQETSDVTTGEAVWIGDQATVTVSRDETKQFVGYEYLQTDAEGNANSKTFTLDANAPTDNGANNVLKVYYVKSTEKHTAKVKVVYYKAEYGTDGNVNVSEAVEVGHNTSETTRWIGEDVTVTVNVQPNLAMLEGYSYFGYDYGDENGIIESNEAPEAFDYTIEAGTKDDGSVHVISVYYVKDIPYTVNYVDEAGNAIAQPKTGAGAKGTVVTEEAIEIKGYTKPAETTQAITLAAGASANNVITFTYTKDESINHKVSARVDYYKDGVLAETGEVECEEGWFGEDTTVTVTPNETDKFEGYEFSRTEGNTSYTVAANAETDETIHVVKVYYVKDSFGYTVQYFYDEKVDDTKTENGTALFGSKVETYIDKVIDGYKLEKTEHLPLTITSNPANNVINVYYVKDRFAYTVNYLEKDTNKVLEPAKTVNTAKFEQVITAENEKIDIDGYNYDSASDDITISTDASANVINLYYVKASFNYTVNYLEQGTNEVLHEQKTGTAKFEQVITGAQENASIEPIDGYVFDSANSTKSITIGTNAELNVLNLYYTKQTNLKYTVQYLEKNGNADGTDKELRPAKTGLATFEQVITGESEQVAINGYVYAEASPESIKISTTESANVLKLYYTKRADLSYTVVHRELGTTNILRTDMVEDATFQAVINSENVKGVFPGYDYHSASTEKMVIGTGANVLNLYYVKASVGYTVVHHVKDSEIILRTDEAEAKYLDEINSASKQADFAGYQYESADKPTLTIQADANDNVINLYYAPKSDTAYTVEHYLKELGENAGYKLADTETLEGVTGETAEAKAKTTYAGFVYNPDAEGTVASGTIAADGSLVLKLYYDRDTFKYTVKYLDQADRETSVAPEEHKSALFGETVTESYLPVDGYNLVGWESNSLTIGTDESANVITFYYTKRADLTYTVKYLEQGSNKELHEADTVGGQTLGAEVKVDNGVDIPGYNKVENSKTIVIKAEDNEVIFYYAPKTDLTYTVKYVDEAGKVLDSKEVTDQTMGAEVTEEAIEIAGYTKPEITSQTITLKATGNVITFVYAAKTDITYTVRYVDEAGKEIYKAKTETGKTMGAEVKEDAIDIPGYTLKVGEQSPKTLKLAATDNVITFVYTANKVPYTVKYVDGDGKEIHDAKNGTGTMDTKVTEEAIAIDGYTKPEVTSQTITLKATGNEIVFHYTRNANTKYTVEYYLQNLARTGYEKQTPVTELFGTTGATVNAEEKTFAGFTLDKDVEGTKASGTIAGDGSLVLKLYYNRNADTAYTVEYYLQNLDRTGYDEPITETLTGTTGATVNAVEKEFKGFTLDKTVNGTVVSGEIKADGTLVLKLYYTRNTATQYLVNHYLEKLDGTGYALKNTEVKKGVTGDTGTAESNKYEGFKFDEDNVNNKLTGEIAGDGSLVLSLYYTRNSYNVTYLYSNEVPGMSDLPTVETVKYGADMSVAVNAKADGYTFSGWTTVGLAIEADGSFKMPAKDVVFTGSFTANDAEYTVKYVDETGKEIAQSVTGKGKVDEKVTEDAIAIDGYTVKEGEATKTITLKPGENVNVIVFTYTLNSYEIKYELGGGTVASENPTSYNVTTETFTLNNPTKEGYTFIGWTGTGLNGTAKVVIIETGSTGNRAYTANWTANKSTIEFVTNGGSNVPDMVGKTDQVIEDTTLPTTSKTGYTFAGWYKNEALTDEAKTLPEKFPVGTTTYYAKWNPATDTKYTVEHYQQRLNRIGYDLVEKDTDKVGTTGATVNAEAKRYAGFTLNEGIGVASGEVKADGTLVLRLYYDRDQVGYTVKYVEMKDGQQVELKTKNVTGKTFGESVTEEAIDIPGYVKPEDESQTIKLTANENVITFTYTRRNDLGYNVRYVEIVDGKEHEIAKTKEVTGQTFGAEVTEEAIKIDGYVLAQGQTETQKFEIKVTNPDVVFYYDKDSNKDDIADKYQLEVTFQVKNGAWDKDGNKADKTVYLPKVDADGNFAVNGTATLSDVPTGLTWPDKDYQATGAWTESGISADLADGKTLTEDTVFVFTYTLSGQMTVKAEGYVDVYDGQGHDPIRTLEVTAPNGDKIPHEELKFTYEGYEPGDEIKDVQEKTIVITVDHDKYSTQKVTVVAKITPATLKIVTDSASKTYDGTALTAPGKVEGLVKVESVAETVTFKVTGTQTDIGKSTNGYELVWDGTAMESNYVVDAKLGDLMVIKSDGTTVIIKPDPTPTVPDPGVDIPDEKPPLANVDDKLNTTDHFAYVVGYPDGEVKPEQNITRAEAVTIFFRLLKDEYRAANWATENPYPDVKSGDWFNNAISTATKAGLFEGDSEGTARPDDFITRAEFATLAARFISGDVTDDDTGDFADTKGHWAAKYIRLAAKAGWITGVGGGKFEPDRNITRAEVMTMVNRMLDRIPDKDHMLADMRKWSDNMDTSAWYYEAVQEATNGHIYERLEGSLAEKWTELQEPRDWAALEKEWSTAQSGK